MASWTDLIQFTFFGGGPVQHAKMDEVKITRLERVDSKYVKKEFVLVLKKLWKVEDARLALYPGDTIFIDHTMWLTIRDVFNLVTVPAVITSAVAQIIWASK